MAEQKKIKLTVPLIISILFMLMPIVDAPSPNPKRVLLLNNPYIEIDFIIHSLCLLFGYFHSLYLIPKFFHKKYKVGYIVSILSIFTVICAVSWLFTDVTFFDIYDEKKSPEIHIALQIRHVFFVFLSVFLFSLMRVIDQFRQKAELERSEAQIQYLKFQLNPHYLFNALNSIFGLTNTNPKQAGEAILDLAGSMRWLLDTGSNLFQPITDTIEGINNYVKMQKRRFGESIEVIFEVEGDPNDCQIPPMLFLPFTENAFKYGINPAKKSKIIIQMKFEGKNLTLHYENEDYSHLVDEKFSTKIGVKNTLSRLEHFYKDNYKLDYGSKDGKYYVDLFMVLK
jgi:sensor histidine kinase YesM